MDYRRVYSNSYQPDYRNNHHPHSHSDTPSHPNSRVDVASQKAKPSHAPSPHSPHSPRSCNRGIVEAANPELNVSQDPRLQQKSVREPENPPSYPLQDVIREFSRQCFHEEKVREAENDLKHTRETQEQLNDALPSDATLLNLLKDKYKRAEIELANRSQLADDSRNRIEEMLESLPLVWGQFLRRDPSTISCREPVQPSREVALLRLNVSSLEEKLNTLIEQNQVQQAELKRLKEQNLTKTSPELNTLMNFARQVNHSIQSLDTRINSMSTQKLHTTIITTIRPLVSSLEETKQSLVDLKNVTTACQKEITTLQAQMWQIEQKLSTNVAPDTNTIRESSAVGKSPAILPNSFVTVREDRTVQRTLEQLKKDLTTCFAQTQSLEYMLTILTQKTADQSKIIITKENLSALLRGALDDFGKNSDSLIGKLIMQHEQHGKSLSETLEKIHALETSITNDRKVFDALRADMSIVEDLQNRVWNIRTDLTTGSQRLDNFETGLARLQQVEIRLDEWQAEIRRPVMDPRFEALLADVKELQREPRETRFPCGDRYVVFENLSSIISEDLVRTRLPEGCIVKDTKVGGGKSPDSRSTTRYMLVWLQPPQSRDVDLEIDAMIEEYTGKAWKGRKTTIHKVDNVLFSGLWAQEPVSVKEHLRTSRSEPNGASNSGKEFSVTPSLLSEATHGVSTGSSRRTTKSEAEETIRVADARAVAATAKSGVPPNRSSSTRTNPIEIQDSDSEDLRALQQQFGAAQDGQRPCRPQPPKRNGSTSMTPIVQVPKRNRSELELSSAAPAKRQRHE